MKLNPHQHTVEPLTVTRIPRAFVSLAVIGQPDRRYEENSGYAELVLKSYSIGEYERVINTYRNNSEYNGDFVTGANGAADYIKSVCESYESVWILCNGVSRCCTLLNYWQQFEEGTFDFGRIKIVNQNDNSPRIRHKGYIVHGGKTEIIQCRYKDTSLTFVSVSNYGDTSVSDIMHQYGDEYDAINCRLGESHELYPDVLDIQRCMAKWYSRMLLNWRANDCGTWKTTSSMLSHSLYRRKFLPAKRTTMRNESLDRLERSSVFGGRAEVYYFGDVCRSKNYIAPYVDGYKRAEHIALTEKIVRIDISSMYPYIFSQYEVPGDCIAHKEIDDMSYLECLCKSDLIGIAAVRIRADIPEFPVRIHPTITEKTEKFEHGFRTRKIYSQSTVEYGIGEFDTVLIGPELEYAYKIGAIKALREIAIYTKSDEYMEYMLWLIGQRYKCKIAGNKHEEKLWKLMANTFGGKLAQRNARWIDCDDEIDIGSPWGELYVSNADTGELTKYRSIANYVQKWQSDTYSPKGRPAVWAMVCSIGRFLMMGIRNLIPQHLIIQQDTDGMYVMKDAIPYLERAGLLADDTPGSIRVVSEHNHIRFWGPRHYIVDGEFIMSGLSTGFVHVIGDDYLDTKESTLGNSRIGSRPETILSTKRKLSLKYTSAYSKCGADGYFKPFRVNNRTNWKPFYIDNMAKLFRNIT